MIPMLRRLKILDYFFFAVIICGALWTGFFLYSGRTAAQRLIVESPGGKWIYPINEERTVSIPGVLGNTLVKIEDGMVFILDSPCPNKTCISAAPLRKSGDWNACLPNKVFLHIEGNDTGDIPLSE